VSANGFGGTVATATTTPAITLTTSITGLLKGNATAISAAVAGTDYLTPSGPLVTTSATTTLSATTHNLVLSASAFQRIDCAGAFSITGIAPPTGTHVDGRMVRIYNVTSPTVNLTLVHNSSLSIAANRFFNSTGADIILAKDDYAELIYDGSALGAGNGAGGLAVGWRLS